MNVTLQNEWLTVEICDLGAELQSLRTQSGVELLWQADPAVWGRHAPLLFPVIGRLRDQRYQLDGEWISIPQHGFARDQVFAVTAQAPDRAVFTLRDSAESRAVYPFQFTLEITYALEGKTLVKSHQITNQSARAMPYELGGHDGYRTTLFPGEEMSDYYLEFSGMTQLNPYHMNADCFLTEEKHTCPLENSRLPLPPRVDGLDTVILEHLPQSRVTLGNRKNPIRLTMTFDQFDYLGIWSTPQREQPDYVCIEPWTTLPESVFAGDALEEKRGIRILPAGGSETLQYCVTVEGI